MVIRLANPIPLLLIFGFLSTGAAQTNLAHSRDEFATRLVATAVERTRHSVRYVSDYVGIPYPGGDVPADTGVCTDEVIRIYRSVGVDLQKEVHEDMVQNFDVYPHGRQRHPDTNIDHRRVPNLMVFFARKGTALPKSLRPSEYLPGDIVAWDLGGGVTHIGIVVDKRGPSGSYMIVHNIGNGPKMEDELFNWKIIGHYRYQGPRTEA
jgi:uncharacterized protein YijF (DUF1287 family)